MDWYQSIYLEILLSYYLENFKKIVYQDLQICALVPLQTTYLETFSCVCSDISNLAHRNSPKLAQINRIIDILLSGEFQENRILGSTDICLGTTPNHIFGDILNTASQLLLAVNYRLQFFNFDFDVILVQFFEKAGRPKVQQGGQLFG